MYNKLTLDEITQSTLKNFLNGIISQQTTNTSSNIYKITKALVSPFQIIDGSVSELSVLLNSGKCNPETIKNWTLNYNLPDNYYSIISNLASKQNYLNFRINCAELTLNNVSSFILKTFGWNTTVTPAVDLPSPYTIPAGYVKSLTSVVFYQPTEFEMYDYSLKTNNIYGDYWVDYTASIDNTLEIVYNEIKPITTNIVFQPEGLWTGEDEVPPIYSGNTTYAPNSQVLENGLTFQAVQTVPSGNDPFSQVNEGNLIFWDNVQNLNEASGLSIRGEYVPDSNSEIDDPTNANYLSCYLRANSSYAYYVALHLDGASYQVGDNTTPISGVSVTKGDIASSIINTPELSDVCVINTATQTATMFNMVQGGSKVFAGESINTSQNVSNVKGFTVNDATTDSTTLSDLVVGTPAVIVVIVK